MPTTFASLFPLGSDVNRTVFGTVMNATGAPPDPMVVTVRMESLKGVLTVIGESTTDTNGKYAVSYDPELFQPHILRVDIDGAPTQVVVSPGRHERVDFKLGAVPGTCEPPRFTEVIGRLQQVLAPLQTQIEELDASGVARLALASGVSPQQAGLARDAVVSSALSAAPASLFYALGEAGLSSAVADLLKHSPVERQRALERAIAEGSLSAVDAAAAMSALDGLVDLMIESALQSPQSIATPGLALDLAGVVDKGRRTAVLETWLQHEGSAEEFWGGLNSLSPGERADVQFALQLDQLTRANAPLIRHLFDSYDSPADLATLDVGAWTALAGTYAVPQFLAAAGVDSGGYARALFMAVEDAFPTPMLAARNAWFSSGTALAGFLGANPTYDLAGLPLREFLRLHPDAILSAGNTAAQQALLQELPALERLYRISPRGARFEVMRDLRAAGVTSATQIQLMGRGRFLETFGATLGDHADEVFRRARASSSAAVMLHLRHRSSGPSAGMAVLPINSADPLSGTDASVTWEALFGGRSFCACGECQSAHGPGAYLADLLFWLGTRDTEGAFLDALLSRRPDLGELELSCKNAHTALPTIDLVLEQLERMVASEGTLDGRQTTLEADELAARPEHVNQLAYDRLAGKDGTQIFYPFDQPYIAALDRTRTFISALGAERSVAIMTLHGRPDAALAIPEIAAELLGMTRTSWLILAGQKTAATAVRWGLGSAGTSTLTEVVAFLRQAGDRAGEAPLTYAALEDLLSSQYVQDAGELSIWFDNMSCDIAGATLVSTSFDDHLDRLSKLIRLSRDLGWTIRDVDRAITILLDGSDLNEPFLLDLAAVRWLERMLGKSPAELLTMWGPLDTRRWSRRLKDAAPSDPEVLGRGRVPNLDGHANDPTGEAEPSPFQKLVQMLADADAFAVTDDGAELANTTALLRDHTDSVAAIAGVDPRTIDPLLSRLELETATLTLDTISQIYREVTLSRALGISTEQFIEWREWLGVDPFAAPTETVRFVAEVTRNASVKLRAEALRALLGAPNTRDLTALGLPRAGAALLALADEVRAHEPTAGAGVFDLTALDEANLLPAPQAVTWTAADGAAVTTGLVDPAGRTNAVRVIDSSAESSYAFVSATDYPSGTPIWCSVWIAKDPNTDPDTAHFAEIHVSYGGTVAARVALDLEKGEFRDQLTSVSDLQVRDAGDWWFVTFRHGGGSGLAAIVVHPAAGVADGTFTTAATTIGAVTVYGPRIALATSDAADPLYPYAARDRAVVRRIAALLGLDVTLVSELLARLRYGEAGVGPSAFSTIIAATVAVAELRKREPVASASPEAVEAYVRSSTELDVDLDAWELIALAGWVCRAFTLNVNDLGWLLDAPASARGHFDVEALVLAGSSAERYSAWAKLRDAARLQSVTTDGHLFDLFGRWLAPPPDYSPSDLRAELAARTPWTEEDLRAAIGGESGADFGGPLGGSSAASWADPRLFAQLAGWMELARRLRVPAAALLTPDSRGWASNVWPADPDAPDPVDAYERMARELESALRGAWGSERWLAEMPDIREGLRNRQRHALLSRIVGDPSSPYSAADDVGQQILMDVQMGACARTSRLKDAIRTVQSFVTRVLLGAEGSLSLSDAEADEWVWRKSYRLWEANRKVFLYPENWLRPELRRDKTPFFAQLEGDLAGGDLREELVEDAYRSYLRKLAEVSKLEVLALLREDRGRGESVQHVFARTRAIPHAYYHRELVDGGRWTPWRELAKVDGEHLIPVVYQRRLMLFWLNFSESAVEPRPMRASTTPQGAKGEPPQRYFTIRLSWSEYRDGRWSGATKSDACIGRDERGTVHPNIGALIGLVSSGVELGSGVWRTFPSTVIHAEASVAADGPDLLIQLWRRRGTTPSGQPNPPLLLPRFRVSAVDGRVTAEGSLGFARHTAPPRQTTGGAFLTKASRFHAQTATDFPLGLKLPLTHAGATGAAHSTVLERRTPGFREDDWIQITPSSATEFDATRPFVFEDNVGSYWATYQPQQRFFTPLGLAGWYWVGADQDLRLGPPKAPAGTLSTTIEVRDECEPPFTSSRKGLNALTDPAAVKYAIGSGQNIVAVNETELDFSSPKLAMSSEFRVEDASGEEMFSARAGSTWDRDGQYQVVQTFKAPIVTNTSLISEGVHLLWSPRAHWKLETFFHPHVGAMRETLNRLGVFGLLDPPSGPVLEPLAGQDPVPATTLAARYNLSAVSHPLPADDLDFSAGGAYAQYNWELFFHAPFLIASRLHEAGNFEQSLKWLGTIFDPFRPARAGADDDEVARSFWRFRPFREQFANTELPRNIQQVVALLSGTSGGDASALATELLQQIADWRRNPFDPHAIARTRTLSYMTAVVMKYLEVLIDWGDQLFAQDTLESIGEAAEYYLLAARILGPRPEEVSVADAAPETFNALRLRFATGAGPAERIEESLAIETWDLPDDGGSDEASSLATLLYFCVPANPQLGPRFWDRVADRLFKIRNCLDIQGRQRELALFEPPIDPDLLVRAAASGIDLRTMLAEVVTGRVPHRRYLAMAELAAGLAASAQGLGQALLASIEKRDADQLATLRNTHERRLQEDAIQVRQSQITDIEHQLEALRHNREATTRRLAYYKDRPRTSPREALQLAKAQSSKTLLDVAGGYATAATVLGLIPELDIGSAGVGGTPKVTVAFGGRALAAVSNAYARGLETAAGVLEREGRMLLAESGYDRRQEEWRLQADLAQKDLDALDERILSMEIQLELARSALATAELRMQQVEEIQDVLERRFAREDLYDWLASQLSGLHYQSYQLAYEFAKKAEKAWQFELGRTDSFIQFGYWDSGRKGLLAADKLGHDLRRMQVAYTELSTRRLEVEQTFSLRELDPVALLRLQSTGEADLALPEAFFDLAYPGHFARRIRAVRLTIPAVVPPNTNVPAHLEIRRHWIRKTANTPSGEIPSELLVEGGYGAAPVTMTATSSGQRDGGVFELDFRGPRLLPFEGAGAVSTWRITLPKAVRPFDYAEIQDVLVHVAYDAEYSGTLRGALEAGSPARAFTRLFESSASAPTRRRVISLRREHGAALRRLVQAAAQAVPASVSFDVKSDVLPMYLRSGGVEMSQARLVLFARDATNLALTINDTATTWSQWSDAGGLQMAQIDGAFSGGLWGSEPMTHTIAVSNWGNLSPGADFDILIVVDLALES